jgi:GNAT superfamily N-acetyltransferase
MSMAPLTSRLANADDLPALASLMDAAIVELQRAYLDDAQIAASRAIMGLDRQLIDDGTYFVVELDGELAGCGGWSRRLTPYGGSHSHVRDDRLRDPATDPAFVRAMYTSPSYTRRGVGRLILSLCESAAAAEGFTQLELVSTLAGEPLYTAYGFRPVERLDDATHGVGDVAVPAIRMQKPVNPELL